jgi:hypothetical protein
MFGALQGLGLGEERSIAREVGKNGGVGMWDPYSSNKSAWVPVRTNVISSPSTR